MEQDQTPDLIAQAAAASTSAELGLLLRQLLRREARQRGDSPWTYRELAAKTGWSLGSISRYLDGKVVAPTDRFDALVRLLGATAAEQGALATARDRVTEKLRQPDMPSPGQVPRQLPRDATWFTGRSMELEQLQALASDRRLGSAGQAVVISAIDGMGGIGKTALAVHAAHRLAEQLPDGQLFIDLHGFTHDVARVEPAEALDRMLRDVGVPAERIPVGLDERATLWRTLLAGRRMLIVLDNAATEAQVQPLLPGTAGCLVLVTSRRRLTALEATSVLSLDTLPLNDAMDLFARTADRPGLNTDAPESAAELVELCGRLPLAIRIAAARLKHRRGWTIADLVARLQDLDRRLVTLDDGWRSVRATLQLSYQDLAADAQTVYRLLGLHPGPDVDSFATAALTGNTLDEASLLLDGLVDVHLLHEPIPGRYRFHDLVRAHANGLAASQATAAQQRAALCRLLDYYRHTAATAMEVAYPSGRQRRITISPAGTPTPNLANRERADRWLDTELANLLAAADYAAKHHWPEHTWYMSAILDGHLRTRGRYREAEALHQQAFNLARHFSNHLAEANALNGLGYVHWVLGRHEQAGGHFRRALQIARDIGDNTVELQALNGLGRVRREMGRYEQADDLHRHALHIACQVGDRVGELYALTGLGSIHRMLGRHKPAADHYKRALRIARNIGSRGGELDALLGLGSVHLRLGLYEQATNHYRRALQAAREFGDRLDELPALNGLGNVHRMLGRHEEAANCYQQVFDLAYELGSTNWQYEARQGLGRIDQANGRPDLALFHHEQALRYATDLAQPADQARAYDGLAHAHAALNQHDHARRHWRDALNILTNLGTGYTQDIEANIPCIRAHLASLDQDQHRPL